MQRLIADLRQFEPDISAIQIAEILWLAQCMSQNAVLPQPESALSITTVVGDSAFGIETQQAETVSPSFENLNLLSSKPPSVQVTSASQSSVERDTVESSALSIPIRVAAARSLRKSIELERSLRPLMRKVPSASRRILDEVATAEQIAETQTQITVTEPALQPWLDLTLVVEETTLTEIWSKTIAEFQELLENVGAFRDVRVWAMRRTETGILELLPRHRSSQLAQRTYHPKELIDPSGKRLILVLSDCTSIAWWSGKIHEWIEIWSKVNLVTIVHLFPQRLWERGVLGEGFAVQLRTQISGANNDKWQVEGLPNWKTIDLDGAVTLPVITLEPEVIKRWALAVVSNKHSASGVLFEKAWKTGEPGSLFDSSEVSAAQLVSQFRGTASPLARRLAVLMAAAPVNLQVVELIQETILPESRQVHLAEVYLSGLLERRETGEFEFREGVRPELRKSLSQVEALLVKEKVSAYITPRLGQGFRSFAAMLTADLQEVVAGNSQINTFAEVATDLLHQMGGEYSAFAEQVLQRRSIKQTQRTTSIRSLLLGHEATSLALQRNANVKAIVTPRWKEEARQTLRTQLGQNPEPDKRTELEQQLQQVQILELGQEVQQGEIGSVFQVEPGENLISKMTVEILLDDGIIAEIRGEIDGDGLLLQRNANVKAIVTPQWMEEARQTLRTQLGQNPEPDKRTELEQQARTVEGLRLGQEVEQGQIGSVFHIEAGENLVSMMNVEVLLNDGIVAEIRGETLEDQLFLQRNVNVKAIVTPRWKEEAQQTLQGQLNQTDSQLQQLEMQMQQTLTEFQRQILQPGSPEASQQSENIRMQFNQRKNELLEQKIQSLQQLQQVQMLDLGQEVEQGQIGSVFQISPGENLIDKMNIDIVLRDGIIAEIRREIQEDGLFLQRNVNVKAIVTPPWKEEAQQTLQAQLNQTDTQLQQLEMQMQQVLTEVQRQTLQPGSPEALQQSENIRMQFNQRKSELLEQKNQSLQQLQQIQMLELNEEVQQGQIGSVFQIQPGDNLIEMMNVEILLRDGVVEEIRGVI